MSNDIVKIRLSNGKVALVNANDFAKVKEFNWYCHTHHGKTSHSYVAAKIRVGHATRKLGVRRKISRILMHRLILDAPRHLTVDHINGNGLDNRRENLRLATMQQQAWNQRSVPGSTSKYRGVCWYPPTQKWRAQICVRGKNINLGYFPDEITAALKYNAAAQKFFDPSFVRFNEVPQHA